MQKPIKLELDTYQEDQLLPLANKIYWHNDQTETYHEVLHRNEKKHKVYIDADERPWDDSHDGNGWQEWRRGYQVMAQAAPPELARQLETKREWRVAESDFDKSYLAKLSATAYASRIAAHILVLRSQKTDTPLTSVKVAPSRWEALHNPTHRNFHLMTRTEKGWQDSVDGTIWHKNDDEWVAGPGQDIEKNENWETL